MRINKYKYGIIRRKLKINFLLIVIISSMAMVCDAFSQMRPDDYLGEFTEYIVMPNKDTTYIFRKPGDWWFGLIGGANVNIAFNDLKIPRRPSDPIDDNNVLINYMSGSGGGFFLGLTGEWRKPLEKWGVVMNIYLFDKQNTSSQSETLKDPYQPPDEPGSDTSTFNNYNRYYEALSSYTYLSLSPSFKYKLPLSGLHLYGGLDLDILLRSDMKHRYSLSNFSDINQDHEMVKVSAKPIRFGMHLGIGYEFYVADISHKMRLNFVPYFSFHGGSMVFDGYGSSMNTVIGRAGIMIKLSPDIIREELKLFDPTYIKPPEYIASVDFPRAINFPGIEKVDLVSQNVDWQPFRESDTTDMGETSVAQGDTIIKKTVIDTAIFVSRNDSSRYISDIDTLENINNLPDTTENIAFADTTKTTIKDTVPVIADIPDRVQPDENKPKFNPNRVLKLYFKDRLNKSDIAMLDEVAKYLIANPGANLRIVGHAATDGNFTQNEASSKTRADAIVRYLVSKNINRRRLLDTYEGSRRAEAPNDTEQGRRKNRRVEIRVIM
jgi:outer membrane protein OmpA-like peptidoglycan-associated protein